MIADRDSWIIQTEDARDMAIDAHKKLAERDAVLERAEKSLGLALGELNEAEQFLQFGIKTEFAKHEIKSSQFEIRRLLGKS